MQKIWEIMKCNKDKAHMSYGSYGKNRYNKRLNTNKIR